MLRIHPALVTAFSSVASSAVSFEPPEPSHTEDLSPEPSNFLLAHHTQPAASSSPASDSASRSPYRGLSSPNVFHSNADTFAAWRCHFLGGAFSLALAYALVHPLDTIKTRIQAGKGRMSTLQAIRQAVFSRATARACLQGFTVSIVGSAPQGGIRFSTYEYTKCKVLKAQHNAQAARATGTARLDSSSSPSPATASSSASSSAPDLPFTHPFLTTAFSAMCGDLASSVVKIPREVITQRLQTGQYASGAQAAQQIFRSEGVLGFYAGYVSTACRDIPFMIVMFSVYENIKVSTGSLLHEHWWCSALAGAASGGLAGLCTTPVDVIKTRIMTSGLQALKEGEGGAGRVRRDGMWKVGTELVREGGYGGLMRGAAARSLWWFCVCGVFFPAYEQSKAVLYELVNHHQHEQQHPHAIRTAARHAAL